MSLIFAWAYKNDVNSEFVIAIPSRLMIDTFAVFLALIDTVRTKPNESAMNLSWPRTFCTFVYNHHRCLSAGRFSRTFWPPRFRFSWTINTRFRVQCVWERPETLAKTRNQWLSVSRARWNFHLGSSTSRFPREESDGDRPALIEARYEGNPPIRLAGKWTFKCREWERASPFDVTDDSSRWMLENDFIVENGS